MAFNKGEKMDVIVIGGSISGLMHAIMLRSLGHNVKVLEQQDSSRSDYGAGIGTGPQGKIFLNEYDTTGVPLAYDCPGFKFLAQDNTVLELSPLPMYLTSWTALYYRLRGLFDGLPSPFCTHPPSRLPNHGDSIFETYKRVISVTPASPTLVTVTFENRLPFRSSDPPSRGSCTAHLVIDASGPYSPVRVSLLSSSSSHLSQPSYQGFIAWRGTVPDTLVSPSTNALFDDRCQIFPISAESSEGSGAGGNYCLGYAVPGPTGSWAHGERHLNWIWYTTLPSLAELEEILTDVEGHTHANSVPRGKLNLTVWESHRKGVEKRMNSAFAELMRKTSEPFVSTIRESFVGQRTFWDGKVVLVGDGSNLMRPNGGQAMNQAAMQCLELREVLKGRMTLGEWEGRVRDEGWRMRLFSNMIADRFLYGGWTAWVAAVRFGVFVRWLGIKRVVKRVFGF